MKKIIFIVIMLMLTSNFSWGKNNIQNIKKGKLATAIVEIPDNRGSASAVCIHPKGLFITNNHVIRMLSQNQRVNLIINPGKNEQKKFEAIICRTSQSDDLAVLRVIENNGFQFPYLELGHDEELSETMEVTAFGYPFGKALASNGSYPEISVNVGRITALRKKNKKLNSIQLDAQLNPGNSGGPVIDSNGNIIGIVKSGVLNSGVNFAIPVRLVKELIEEPAILFQPDPIAYINKEQSFVIEVEPFLNKFEVILVEMILKAKGHKEQRFIADSDKNQKNRYIVKATPIPDTDDFQKLWFPGKATFYCRGCSYSEIKGLVLDQEIEMNERKVWLSEIKTISYTNNSSKKILLHNNKVYENNLNDFKMLKMDIGGMKIDLQTENMKSLRLYQPTGEVTPIYYEINVKRRNKIIASRKSYLPQIKKKKSLSDISVNKSGPISLVPSDSSDAYSKISGTENEEEPDQLNENAQKEVDYETIRTSSKIYDACLAAGGKLLLLYLKEIKKVAVFDIQKERIITLIPIGSENALITAGIDKMLAILPSETLVESYSLKSFKREKVKPIPIQGYIKNATMGYASHGPLLILSADSTETSAKMQYSLWDINTLEELQIKEFDAAKRRFDDDIHIRASGNGKVFGCGKFNSGNICIETFTIIDDRVKVSFQPNKAGHIVPNSDGTKILTGLGIVMTPEVKEKIPKDRKKRMPVIPTLHPNLYISVPTKPNVGHSSNKLPFKGMKPGLHIFGQKNRIVFLPDLKLGEPPEKRYNSPYDDFTIDKRVIYDPDSGQLISIPYTNDRLIVYNFNFIEKMEESNLDYFYVISTPPSEFQEGQTYQYDMQLISKHGGLEYELSNSPKGMTIDSNGRINWKIPSDFSIPKVYVIVTVRDKNGNKIFDSFTIKNKT